MGILSCTHSFIYGFRVDIKIPKTLIKGFIVFQNPYFSHPEYYVFIMFLFAQHYMNN